MLNTKLSCYSKSAKIVISIPQGHGICQPFNYKETVYSLIFQHPCFDHQPKCMFRPSSSCSGCQCGPISIERLSPEWNRTETLPNLVWDGFFIGSILRPCSTLLYMCFEACQACSVARSVGLCLVYREVRSVSLYSGNAVVCPVFVISSHIRWATWSQWFKPEAVSSERSLIDSPMG